MNRNDDCNNANNNNVKDDCCNGWSCDFSETNIALQYVVNDDHELRQCDCGMLFLICVIGVVEMAAPW